MIGFHSDRATLALEEMRHSLRGQEWRLAVRTPNEYMRLNAGLATRRDDDCDQRVT